MFQSFANISDPSRVAGRVSLLRDALDAAGLRGILVPRADAHQGEYVAPASERLYWLTGFSGSAGQAIVLGDRAALFVDGRYTLQSRDQTDTGVFEILQVPEEKPADWLNKHLTRGDRLAYDPWLHTVDQITKLTRALKPSGAEITPLETNLVDTIWTDRPDAPCGTVTIQPLEFAGTAAEEKIAALQATLKDDDQDAVVLTLPDSIAWLFNIRGADIPHTPVALSFAIVPADGRPRVFIDSAKLVGEAGAHLAALAEVHPPADFAGALTALGENQATVRIDPETAAIRCATLLEDAGAKLARATDPALTAKARKNKAERDGTRAAHIRDGAAMVRFLAWLERTAPGGGKVTEIDAAKALERVRADTNQLEDISFDTISGSGPNGAIVHYRVTEATDRVLGDGELYLIDSGGQYRDGTTDITRTVAIAAPTDEMRRCFTLVLKGHIAIATARFPKGTRGVDLDPFARAALWQAGLDFDHGTGHGVGSYLSVHEGPASISRRGLVALEPGMLLSNEPGYYRQGAFGIRIENLILVNEPAPIAGGERDMMSFETVSFAPLDRQLIDVALLTPDELAWINGYHGEVREKLGSLVDGEDKAWLHAATAPLEA